MTPLPPRIEVVESEAARLRFDSEEDPAELSRVSLSGSSAALAGFAVLLIGLPLLAAIGLVVDQFRRDPILGWATAAVVAGGFTLLFWAVSRDVVALSKLRSIEVLRAELARPEAFRRLRAVRQWEALLRGAGHHGATHSPADADAAVALLRAGPGMALRHQADRLGRVAAIQVAAGIAAVPSPSLDALLVAWRALRLVREIAALYGMRPGLLATVALMRRSFVTATLVGGLEAASNAATSALLSNKLLAHLAGDLAGAGIAARRMMVLARAVAAACDPLPPDR